ncbi:MAG: DnaJ domain-containing protein [Fimbriimonas ginsengisoli]|uniref:DnaJ domain-containing protein n=1 Tax=Fimbriimonas ginsengisoli TaxID=1005039 RepID=A0A931PSK7_FIMGI|nr:DnaJ domain-containing protein [Fimbriimonas ginsengisoli]
MTVREPSMYKVLGVEPRATPETLRRAYRKLARSHHPDVSDAPDAHESMARINEAFETLIDPARREEYDAGLAGGPRVETRARREPQQPVVVRLLGRLKAHITPVYAVAFEPDSGRLVSSAFDNELVWWSRDGEEVRKGKLDSGVVSSLRCVAGERLVAAGSSESTVASWVLDKGTLTSTRTSVNEWVSCVAISPDGASVAAGSIHRILAVAPAEGGRFRFRKQAHGDSVTALAWSSDGRLLASGSADATVKLWDAATGKHIRTIDRIRSTVTAIAFAKDGRLLAAAGADLSIRIFELATGRLDKMVYGHDKPIETLAFHPNGWLIASGSRDGTIGLWNATKGIAHVRIKASNRPISCVAFSTDGLRFAAGGQDRIVRMWEVTAKAST